MKMLYEYYGDSLTWICNTMPIFLDEDEYDEDKPEALYDLPDDLKDKNIAVQSTTKPEDILLNGNYDVGNLISLNHRELIFTFLQKGYVDAIGAHEESIIQYMKDYNADFRILEEPLMRVGIGVAFSKNDKRDLCEKLDKTLKEMCKDGTSKKIIGKYLSNPEKYLEVDDFAY